MIKFSLLILFKQMKKKKKILVFRNEKRDQFLFDWFEK